MHFHQSGPREHSGLQNCVAWCWNMRPNFLLRKIPAHVTFLWLTTISVWTESWVFVQFWSEMSYKYSHPYSSLITRLTITLTAQLFSTVILDYCIYFLPILLQLNDWKLSKMNLKNTLRQIPITWSQILHKQYWQSKFSYRYLEHYKKVIKMHIIKCIL